MQQFAKLVRTFDNWSNPILVKEIRQAVKGKFLIVILGLILMIQLIMWWIFTLPSSYQVTTGLGAYGGMLALFGISLGFCMPLYTGWRLLVERMNHDLLYVSALSPFQIIWGKFMASASIILIVFTTFLPFFYLTLLLGGIDFLTITYTLLVILTALLTSVTFTIFLFSGVVPILLRVFLILMFFGGNIYLGSMAFMTAYFMFEDFGFMQDLNLIYSVSWVLGGILVNGLFIVLSAAIISPGSSNRAFAPRIYTTFMVAAGAAIMILVINLSEIPPLPGVYYAVAMFIAMFVLLTGLLCYLISASGRFSYGMRLKKAIPTGPIKKLICFPFYSGAANGIIWSLGFIALAFAAMFTISALANLNGGSGGGGMMAPDYFFDAENYSSFYHQVSWFNYTAIYSLIGMILAWRFKTFRPITWTIFLVGIVSGGTIVSFFSFLEEMLDYDNRGLAFILVPNAALFLDGPLIIRVSIVSGILHAVLFLFVYLKVLRPQIQEYFRQGNAPQYVPAFENGNGNNSALANTEVADVGDAPQEDSPPIETPRITPQPNRTDASADNGSNS